MAALEAGAPSANIDLLGAWNQGGGQEADAWGDHLFVDRGNEVFILDVSDPRSIEQVSSIALPEVVDVKVSDDGQWLFAGGDESASGEPLGGIGPFTGGIYVVDISDKTTPTLEGYLPVGHQRATHMLTYHQMPDGRELVFGAAGPDVVITAFDRSTATLEEIARYTPGQLAQDRDPNRIGALYNPQGWLHDMFVMDDPVAGTLMYVAAWDAGLRVVDVSKPAAPEELGSWSDFGEGEAGNLHTVATEWIGDQRITVGAVEVGFGVVGGTYYATGDEKSVLYVWDTTDPTSPTLLSTWVNPIDPTSGRDLVPDEEITSTHNLQLEEGRVYLAHYALGVWVLDVSTHESQEDPAILGYYNDGEMNTWDVVLLDGVLFSSGQVGIQGLHFVLDDLGPSGVTSRA